MQLTYKFRLRDKHRSELKRQSRAVNFVWNFCNETQRTAARSSRKWLSGYDLEKLAAGTSKDLDLHAHTIAKTASQYARSREQHKRPWLRWRGQKSLGWVPFNTGHATFEGKAFVFRAMRYEPMHLRGLLRGARFGAGSFSADSRGRWLRENSARKPAHHRRRCEPLEDCQDPDGQEFARRRMGRFQNDALVQVHEEWRDVF